MQPTPGPGVCLSLGSSQVWGHVWEVVVKWKRPPVQFNLRLALAAEEGPRSEAKGNSRVAVGYAGVICFQSGVCRMLCTVWKLFGQRLNRSLCARSHVFQGQDPLQNDQNPTREALLFDRCRGRGVYSS